MVWKQSYGVMNLLSNNQSYTRVEDSEFGQVESLPFFFCHSLFVPDVTSLRNSLNTSHFLRHNRGFIVSYFSSSCCGTRDFLKFFLSKSVLVPGCVMLCTHITYIHVLIHFTSFGQVFYHPHIIYWHCPWASKLLDFTTYYHSLKCQLNCLKFGVKIKALVY
jgi:hypothetical protein